MRDQHTDAVTSPSPSRYRIIRPNVRPIPENIERYIKVLYYAGIALGLALALAYNPKLTVSYR